jgi:hypothetical protein
VKIKFVSGPKQGTIEHLQPSIANVLIASGMAEHIPYKSYVERLNEESTQANKKPPCRRRFSRRSMTSTTHARQTSKQQTISPRATAQKIFKSVVCQSGRTRKPQGKSDET